MHFCSVHMCGFAQVYEREWQGCPGIPKRTHVGLRTTVTGHVSATEDAGVPTVKHWTNFSKDAHSPGRA